MINTNALSLSENKAKAESSLYVRISGNLSCKNCYFKWISKICTYLKKNEKQKKLITKTGLYMGWG